MESLEVYRPSTRDDNTTPRQLGASPVMSMVLAIVLGVTFLMVLVLPAPSTGTAVSKTLAIGDLKSGRPDAKHHAWVKQNQLTEFEMPLPLKTGPGSSQINQKQPLLRSPLVSSNPRPMPFQNTRVPSTIMKGTLVQDPGLEEGNSPEVPPAASTKEIEEAFDRYDIKKTGELGPAELGKVLDDLGYSAAEQQDVFQALDLDGNGQVTKEEFCTNVRSTATQIEFYKRLFKYLQTPKEKGKAKNADAPEPGTIAFLQSMAEFEEFTVKAGESPVVVEFFAPWCRKCAALGPKYKQLARSYDDRVVFAKISVSKIKDSLEGLGVKELPTFQVWKEGKKKDEYVAGKNLPKIPKEIAEMIDCHLQGFSLLHELSKMEFEKVDIDGSGIITRDELLETFDHDWSREKIDEAFNELDANSDGGISRQEFEEFVNRFGGSCGSKRTD